MNAFAATRDCGGERHVAFGQVRNIPVVGHLLPFADFYQVEPGALRAVHAT